MSDNAHSEIVPLTRYSLNLRSGLRLELIYKTPDEQSQWNAIALLDEIERFPEGPFANDAGQTYEEFKPDFTSIQQYLCEYEEMHNIQRQDMVENNKIIPSCRFFFHGQEYCIHTHENRLYSLFGISCAYILDSDHVPEIEGIYNHKQKKGKDSPFMHVESEQQRLLFITKHQYSNNLDLARHKYDVKAGSYSPEIFSSYKPV